MSKLVNINNQRVAGWWVLLASILGVFSSANLLVDEFNVLKSPASELICDVNPLITCSDSLLSPQAHLLFGLPNSLFGVLFFAVLVGLSSVLVFGGSLPRVVWVGAAIGATLGLGYVIYFVIISLTLFKAICPFCSLIWVAVFFIFPITIIRALKATVGFGSVKKSLIKYWWGFPVIVILLLVFIILVTLVA